MKIITIKTFKYFILVSSLALMWSCTEKDPHAGHKMGSKEQKNADKKRPKYISPMHPQITSDKPGKCPICGMDLIPIDEYEKEFGAVNSAKKTSKADLQNTSNSKQVSQLAEKPDDRATVRLSFDKQQIIGVHLATVKKRKLFREITAPGRVAFDPELYTAQSEYLEALKQWAQVKNSPLENTKKNTKEMIRSSKIRLRVLGLSEGQIKSLARERRQSESLILAGKDGNSWIYADVFEQELSNITKGLPVELSASFLQGKKLFGEVSSVDEVINPQTRTAKLRISVNSKTTKLRPESFVTVSIFAPLGELKAIPKSAVIDTGKERFVFVKKGEGEFEPRTVTIIKEGDDYYGVGDELKVDETVVVSANFMIDSESRLKSVIINAGKASSSHDDH